MPIDIPEVAWSAFAPELATTAAALLLMVLSAVRRARVAAGVIVGAGLIIAGVWLASRALWAPAAITIVAAGLGTAALVGLRERPLLADTWVATLAALAALALSGWQWQAATASGGLEAATALGGAVAVDGIALFTRFVVYATAVLVLPLSYGYLVDRRIHRPEFAPLVLWSVTGMALLGAAADLLLLFVALELLSLPLYVLAGLARRDRRSQEAGMKYFLLGAVASAVLLYGIALLYAATGTLDIATVGVATGLVTTPERMALAGAALLVVGLGFKVALVPFHLWTPDVYQGAPTNVTAFMAAATKAAGFAAVLRVFDVGLAPLDDLWAPVLAVLAAVTMVVGAVVALVQDDVKRLLAYSSLAHAGYAAVGVVAGGAAGRTGTLWYLATYAASVVAAFGAVLALERQRRGDVTVAHLRGLGRRSPALAGLFTLALLSLAGIPPTAGFAGKWVVFSAGIAAGWTWLVVVGILTSVVAAGFYLKLIGAMYLDEPAELTLEPVTSPGLSLGLAAAAAAVVVLGVVPAGLLGLAEQAAVVLR